MATWLPSLPYPTPGQTGFWDPVTSTLDWCEENYYATPYSAEIINTATNLLFIALAARGALNCIREGHDTVFLVSFVGYGFVGTSSALFHSTLKYPMQLLDEMSMIIVTLIMLYASFSHQRSAFFGQITAIICTAIALFIAVYYHYLQDPAFHQTAYALLTVILLSRSMWIMEFTLRPALVRREKERGSARSRNGEMDENGRDGRENTLTTMWWMIAFGLGIFLGGFGIWNLDNEYCSTLRSWRRELGMPWGFLLEGHGWWHLMTGTGAYFYVVWGIWLRYCLEGREDQVKLVWTSAFSLPDVVRRSASTRKVQ